MALAGVAGAAAIGPLFATIQTLVPQRMRATSIAIIYLFANLIGLGLGPLATTVPTVPAAFARIVQTLLAKRPSDRYSSARVLQTEFARLERDLELEAIRPSSVMIGGGGDPKCSAIHAQAP